MLQIALLPHPEARSRSAYTGCSYGNVIILCMNPNICWWSGLWARRAPSWRLLLCKMPPPVESTAQVPGALRRDGRRRLGLPGHATGTFQVLRR